MVGLDVAQQARTRKHGHSETVSVRDAPRAASSRNVRRAWVTEVNRVLRRTGDRRQALEAGAHLIMAALDCDALALMVSHAVDQRHSARHANAAPPVTLPQAARRRMEGRDGARDHMVQAILRGQAPGDPDWPGHCEVTR